MFKKFRQLEQIDRVAARQWGHITRGQLLEIGVAPTTIHNWIGQHLLVRVHHGVYAVGHAETTSWARAAAAVLAAGADAALGLASSLALWDLGQWPRIPEVISPRLCRRPGIRHHRSSTLTPADIRRRHGIRTTSVARTISDLQPRLTDRRLIRLVNDARLKSLLPGAQLERLLAASPRIRRLIDPTQRPTRSGFEDDFIAFCVHHGLPTPMTNTTVDGVEVDALFPAQKVIVEIDSWKYHRSRASFLSDRERDLRTTAAGHVTVRIPDGGLDGPTGTQTAARLGQILRLRTR